jgi:hypothetical protein
MGELTAEQVQLKKFVEACGKELCERCHCCTVMWETAPCPMCGGFCGDEWVEDEWDDGWCDGCSGEGTIEYAYCSCDKDGKHVAAKRLTESK